MGSSTYAISTRWLGAKGELPIDAEVFAQLRGDRDCLVSCIGLEDAYDLLALNYISFETALVGAVVKSVVESRHTRADYEAQRREIDRHLVNLLAVGQMFVGHLDKAASQVFGRKSAERDSVRLAIQTQREKFLGYRATERLRDAVLHRTLPISAWTQGGSWVERDAPHGGRRQETFSVSFDPTMLADGRTGEATLIAELQLHAEKGRVNWVPVIREYVEGLSAIHQEGRKVFAGREATAVTRLASYVAAYREQFGKRDSPISVIALERDAGGVSKQEMVLDFDYAERVEGLRSKNRPLVNLHKIRIVG